MQTLVQMAEQTSTNAERQCKNASTLMFQQPSSISCFKRVSHVRGPCHDVKKATVLLLQATVFNKHVDFLVDSGAERSVIPLSPVYSKPRILSPPKFATAKEEFDKLLALNIIRPSCSPWASPLHMVCLLYTSDAADE